MKTLTKALIAAALAIATVNVNAAERFELYRNNKATVPVCVSLDSIIDLHNADISSDREEVKAILRKECTMITQAGREFEITTEWRHISEIVFYKDQCELDNQKYYVDNKNIMSYTPEQIKEINDQLRSIAASNKAVGIILIEPPVCGQDQAAGDQVDADKPILYLNDNPSNFIVCNTLGQAKELAGMQDGWPKGCFAGAPSDKVTIKTVKGAYAQAAFQLEDGSWSNDYWLDKTSFND